MKYALIIIAIILTVAGIFISQDTLKDVAYYLYENPIWILIIGLAVVLQLTGHLLRAARTKLVLDQAAQSSLRFQFGALFEFRDIIVWMIFAFLYFAFKQRTSKKVTYALFIITGVLIGLSPFVSIDRGIGLLAIGAGLGIMLILFSKDKNNVYKFNPGKYKGNWKHSAAFFPVPL